MVAAFYVANNLQQSPRAPTHLRNHSDDDLRRVSRCFRICNIGIGYKQFICISIYYYPIESARAGPQTVVADDGDQFLFFLFDFKLYRMPEVDSCLIIYFDRSLPIAVLYTNYTRYIIHMIITQRLILLCNYIILYII